MGLLRDTEKPLKVLGDGELKGALHISAHKVSEGARQKIEAAGGSVTLLEMSAEPRRDSRPERAEPQPWRERTIVTPTSAKVAAIGASGL